MLFVVGRPIFGPRHQLTWFVLVVGIVGFGSFGFRIGVEPESTFHASTERHFCKEKRTGG